MSLDSVVDLRLFVSVFVTLFVIMDPPGTIPLILSLTGGRSPAIAVHVIRDGGVSLISRIAGLLLSAIAVQLVADVFTAFVRAA